MKNDITKSLPRTKARGIPQVKKDDILCKLGTLMPPTRLKFWKDIPVTDVADLRDLD